MNEKADMDWKRNFLCRLELSLTLANPNNIIMMNHLYDKQHFSCAVFHILCVEQTQMCHDHVLGSRRLISLCDLGNIPIVIQIFCAYFEILAILIDKPS